MVRGLTTAATVFAVAGIGIVIGYGHMFLGVFLAAVLMFVLEIEHIPGRPLPRCPQPTPTASGTTGIPS